MSICLKKNIRRIQRPLAIPNVWVFQLILTKINSKVTLLFFNVDLFIAVVTDTTVNESSWTPNSNCYQPCTPYPSYTELTPISSGTSPPHTRKFDPSDNFETLKIWFQLTQIYFFVAPAISEQQYHHHYHHYHHHRDFVDHANNSCFRLGTTNLANTNDTTGDIVSNPSNSQLCQYSSQNAAHLRYDTATSSSANPTYWSLDSASNPISAPPTSPPSNFQNQNCYSNYYTSSGSIMATTPTTPASQNNPYFNAVPPPPPVVVYPHLYSTVNQNQIHLHLHHTDLNRPMEQYADELTNVLSGAGGPTRNIEIGASSPISQPSSDETNAITRYGKRQGSNESVWRPYTDPVQHW